jgi:lon-related putative ATP-dependent protease
MPPVPPLAPEQLFTPCALTELEFETTADLPELEGMLGQERAVAAIELGSKLALDGFNLFLLGPPGTGRHSFIQDFLKRLAADQSPPADWCYLNNFDDPRRPRAVKLPAGWGRRFRDEMLRLIEEACSTLPAAFESEDYQSRRQAIEEEANREQEKAFAEVREHAREHDLAIMQTATGFNIVPLVDGKALTPEHFGKLPPEERERLQENSERMGRELRKMLQAIPARVRKVRERIDKLNREVALFAVGGLIEEMLEQYRDNPRLVGFLKELQHDIADNVELFLQQQDNGSKVTRKSITGRQMIDPESPIAHRYGVNLLVDHSDASGAPVVFEDHPTYPYLLGQIEHIEKQGVLSTNFLLIRPGALHRANGGYLILDARKVLFEPFAWDALKRVLKAGRIDLKSLAQAYSLVSTVSLEPEPIPLQIKVVLIGERLLYYLLQHYDPEFIELFKIAADFEGDMERSSGNVRDLATLLGAIARRERLHPLDRAAVGRIIEESARHAGDAGLLSTQIRRLADIVREAHYWAEHAGKTAIGGDEVTRAISGRRQRSRRIEDTLQRETLRGTIVIATDGHHVGQVNGLSVLQMGDYQFGRPTRISARVSLGSGKLIDIEREVKLGGPIHSKGVLILSGYIASHYVGEVPASFSASLVFEQSYGPVEGDSASAAELCALLSALADTPLRQDLAITGAVSQDGRILAIGGVNQKIEGFFDLCQARGLSGSQGVIIPGANVRHLMLSDEVVEAVRAGRFSIYAVSDIDQCLELLSGTDAGLADANGAFPAGSLNRRIADRLRGLAEQRRRFGASATRHADTTATGDSAES